MMLNAQSTAGVGSVIWSSDFGGGGAGFFLACGDFSENVGPFIPRLRFFFSSSEVESNARTLIPLFLGQDQSTVARRAETTVAECSRTSCV